MSRYQALIVVFSFLLFLVSYADELSAFNMSLEKLLDYEIKSASLFEDSVLTTGSSVSVIERSDWQRIGARSMLDAISNQPSVQVLPSAYGLNVISIRGYSQVASARGIATLLDGIPTNGVNLGSGQYATQNVQLGVLDRIELTRGPGSALYGSDAFHGVLALSAFESEEDVTRISAEGGGDDYYQTGVQHSVGFKDGSRVNIAFAASGEDKDSTYIASGMGTEQSSIRVDESYQSQTLSLKTSIQPTPSLKVVGGFYFDNYAIFDHPAVPNTVTDSKSNSRTMAGQITATQDLFTSGLTFEARIYHINNLVDRFAFGSSQLGLSKSSSHSEESRSAAIFTLRQPEIKHIKTRFAFGFGYEQAQLRDGTIEQALLDGSTPVMSKFPGIGETRDIGHVLLDARTVLPDDRWALNYGGRLDEYSELGIQATPRLGLVFQPDPNTAYKLLYNKAFRAPTISEEFRSSTNLNPETLDSYEFVFAKKYESWIAEITLFENHWEDGIIFVLDPSLPTGFEYRNEGKNRARGVEASCSWLSQSWRIDLSGSYVESKNLKTDMDYELFPQMMGTIGVTRKFTNGTEFSVYNSISDQAMDISSPIGSYAPQDLTVFWRTDLTFKKPLSTNVDFFANVLNLFNRNNRVPAVLCFPDGEEDGAFRASLGLRAKW